jgi:4-aminobutyrate aminotransferase-like enzyme
MNQPVVSGTFATDSELLRRRESAMSPAYRLFYEKPVHLVRGEGVWLHDSEGRKYLDCYNNVASVGHCHPNVVDALTRQASTLNTHTRYLHDHVVNYAERLAATLPGDLSVCMFVCTGSEANDLAFRMARTVTGNPVSAAAGLAVLDVIEREKILQNVHDVGAFLGSKLKALAEKYELVGDVRGKGLFYGVEIVRDRATLEPGEAESQGVREFLRENGVLVGTTGPLNNVVKIRPPMVFSKSNAELLLETLEQALDSV